MIPTTAPPDAAPSRPTTGSSTHELPTPLPDPVTLAVVSWDDPVLERRGHDPRSEYVERFWLPILGPSTTWLLRRFARGFEEFPGGFRIDLADTSRALGLGEGTGRNSMITRSVERACQFGMSQRHGLDRLSVRTHLPPLTQRQLSRLPLALQHAHDRRVAEEQRERVDLRVTSLPPRPPDRLRPAPAAPVASGPPDLPPAA